MIAGRRAVSIPTRDGVVWLVARFDAWAAERAGTHERLSATEASWCLRGAQASGVQSLLPRGGASGLPFPASDGQILAFAERLLKDGELEVVREARSTSQTTAQQDADAHITRKLERLLKGQPLVVQGGRYRVLAGQDVGRLPARDEHQVVSRAAAAKLLAQAATAAANAELRTALGAAGERLSPDWQPPQKPCGIVVLRHVPLRAHSGTETSALTPAALKKAAREDSPIDIEIVVIDPSGKPWKGAVHVVAPDGEELEEALTSGKVQLKSLKPGTCAVLLKPSSGSS